MPLGTVVRDVYREKDRQSLYDDLSMLLGTGWHRAGVYCFWDPASNKALYIGLAKDLPTRFAQHNGLRGTRPGPGNKGKQINDWFLQTEQLGFSVVLQEAMADETYEPFARNAEGQLLEGYRKIHGRLPPWNRIGGSRVGASHVIDNSGAWVDLMTGTGDSLLVARRTIRGLNEDPDAEYTELVIHPARSALLQLEGIDDIAILRAVELITRMTQRFDPFAENLTARTISYLTQPAPHPERLQ